ncbi:Putative repressor protein [Lactobacillus delbrueckii subsp. bulgaricus 2038]|nr:Putative repressor protein [Lactobacillus delbrueckii subsp. bulgaricus 2038]
MKKSERLNQELIFLSDKKRFNLQDLMDNFQISKRTALRDIASLEELGLALYAEAGRAGGYSLIQEDLLTKIYFNSDEVAAIFFALKAMEQLKETPFNESFQMISQKLLKNLAASRQQQVLASQAAVSFFNTPAVHHNPYLRLLMESILHDFPGSGPTSRASKSCCNPANSFLGMATGCLRPMTCWARPFGTTAATNCRIVLSRLPFLINLVWLN